MEPLQPARRADGEHTRFHAAHMAANLRRIFSTFIWIITMVTSSRTRIYPPNEGECGGNGPSCTARSGFPLRHAGTHRCERSVRVPGWQRAGRMCLKLEARELDFGGNVTVVVYPGFSRSFAPKEFSCTFSLSRAVTKIFCFLDIST